DPVMTIFYHRQSLHNSFGDYIIKWNLRGYLYPLSKTVVFNLTGIVLVDIILIDTYQSRDIKMAANAKDSLQVMYAG
ncbi:unnamed protein product, partial [marine sediment metagenome]